jgi:hypothetical protein
LPPPLHAFSLRAYLVSLYLAPPPPPHCACMLITYYSTL